MRLRSVFLGSQPCVRRLQVVVVVVVAAAAAKRACVLGDRW
jgi:hypothetical protein